MDDIPAGRQILFFKAKINGAGADLFASTVEVHGYTKRDGTYVAPHRGIRHKGAEAPSQADLFAPPAAKPPPKAAPKRTQPAELPQHDLFAPPAPAPEARDFAWDVKSKDALREYVQSAKGMTREANAALAEELKQRSEHGDRQWTVGFTGTGWAVDGPDGRLLNDPATGQPWFDQESAISYARTERVAPPAPVDPSAPKEVPARIKQRVAAALASLHDVAEGIESGREGDRQFQGNGRYEADALGNRKAEIDAARATLAKFREQAAKLGIDGQKIIDEMGGEPDLTPSPAAAEWLKPKEPETKPASDVAPTVPEQPGALPLVEHTTGKGKVLRGVVRTDLTQEQAKAIDEYTFKKDGGWFIREKHLPPGAVGTQADDGEGWTAGQTKVVDGQTYRLEGEPIRWHLVGDAEPAADAKADPAEAPVKPGRTIDNKLARLKARRGIEGPLKQWGVPAGIKASGRKRLNASAVALLNEKTDDEMTEEDRDVLAQYSGTGGQGVGDSLNEFYTPPAVASAMWAALTAAGFEGGEVLEPSSGTGVFLRTAPESARVQAVELDPIAGRIAGILHRPAGHDVQVASLERFATQDGRQFDAIIGNAPFGPRGDLLRDDKPDIAKAEEYFLDTGLDKLKDGGVMALIVPTGIMNSSNGRGFREGLLRKAEFLGAIRMPNTAFEASHTDVTTDILMFRKRPQAVAGALSTVPQAALKSLGLWDDEFLAGTYFEGRGADNVLGRVGTATRAFGEIYTVNGSMAGVPESIADWQPEANEAIAASPTVQAVLDSLGDDAPAVRRAYNAALKPPYQVAKPGDVKVMDGIRYILQGEPPRWHRADSEVSESVEDAHAVAALLDRVGAAEPGADLELTRAKLIEALDAYVATHGIPGKNKDLLAWLKAPVMDMRPGADAEDHGRRVADAQRRTARLLGAVDDNGRYSDLVMGRGRVGDVASIDTLAEKLSLEEGGFTVAALADAADVTEEAALDHLFASPDYAVDPDGKTWSTLSSYLGGNLWPKLDAARATAEDEGLPAAYRDRLRKQAAELEAVIAPASLNDVEIAINSGFITPEILTAWFTSLDEDWRAKNPGQKYNPGRVDVIFADGVYDLQLVPGSVGADWQRLPNNADLIERYLNRTGVRKTEKDEVDQINTDFRSWLLASEYRDGVEEHYNRTYRGFVPRAYADTPIAIAGLNPALDVNGYHYAGIRWAMEAGSGIVAADVGLGKTGRGLMLTKLLKSTGQAKKPVIVVPKSVMANWVAEAEFWFPGSSVLTIGETYKTDKAGNVVSKADDAETRQRKLHQLQQNDHDFVFISVPAWNQLDVDPDTKERYQDDDFWAQRAKSLEGASSKAIHKAKVAAEQKAAQREFHEREKTIFFNDLGVDAVMLDEGHAYKNLFSARNRWGQSPKFLGASGESKQALDTMFKTRAVRDANDGKGVFMLTATPTKNSPLEIYSMLAHIAPQAFVEMGIKNSEEFIDRFVEFSTDRVLTTGQETEETLVTSGFKNLDELRGVMRRYIDRKTAEDVGLVIPAADVHEHYIDMTAEQTAVYDELREQLKGTGKKDGSGDGHIFSIMDKMGKASLDLTLLDRPGGRSPKIDALVANVGKLKERGGQLIFCDSNQTHGRIRDALIAGGMKPEEIGIINADVLPSSAARQKVTDQFNRGILKAVVGNTSTMGEGLNMQKSTSDIHHIDLPWNPAQNQQRNGRARRQGNKRDSIGIHTYLAKRSFDGYRWQTIASKASWQDLLWNGGNRVENLARDGAFSRDDVLIMMSADPDAERAKIAENKALAEAQHKAAERGKMIDNFSKLRDMRRSLAELQAKGSAGKTVDRLVSRAQSLRRTLEVSSHFTHKDLLDGDAQALIEPVTDHAYKAGTAFDLAPGKDGPFHWSDTEPSKWVVTDVHPDEGQLTMRQYGVPGGRPVSAPIADFKSGVSPFTYDSNEESQAIETAMAERKRVADAGAVKEASDSLDIADYKKMPVEIIERLAPGLQKQMKQAVLEHRTGGYHTHYGMVDKEGNAELMPSYDARRKVDTHDFILPTREGRQKALAAHVAAALDSKITTHYDQTGRKNSYGGKPNGIERRYPKEYQESPNPWSAVVRNVMGTDAEAQAHRMLRDAVTARIKAAPDLHAAIEAALPLIDTSRHVGNERRFPQEVVEQLRDKAAELGVTHAPAHRHIKPPKNSGRQPVHHALTGYYDQEAQDTSNRRVIDYLRSLLPSGARDKLEETP